MGKKEITLHHMPHEFEWGALHPETLHLTGCRDALFSKPVTSHSLVIVLISFLFLCSRIALTRLAERARGRKALTPSEITKATEQVYLNDSDGRKMHLVVYHDQVSKVSKYLSY